MKLFPWRTFCALNRALVLFTFCSTSIYSALAIDSFPAVPQAASASSQANKEFTNRPDLMLDSVITPFMSSLPGDPSTQSVDIKQISALFDQKVVPYIDFQRATAFALGREWRYAAPGQQRQIAELYKILFTHQLMQVLLEVRGQNIRFSPRAIEFKRGQISPDDIEATVRCNVGSKRDGKDLIFEVIRTSDGWRIFDFDMDGTLFTDAYKAPFAQAIGRNGINGLIQFMTQQTQRIAY